MWNLIRLLPPIIGPEIYEGNEVWSCCIEFVQLVNRACAPSFILKELEILETLIQEFFFSYIYNYFQILT